MEKHSVSRMIGAPPGYVGYDEGGALTEAVRRRPYQVVLFDEVEKAHPDVFNVLLQVLDDGRLTDGQGRTVDFRNTLIIMTSNLGSEYLAEPSVADGEVDSVEAVRPLVMDVVRKHFRPEFLNRIDEIILFHRLGREQMDKIVKIQLQRVEKLLADRRMSIDLDAGAAALAGRTRLRPGLWRPPAEAGDPEGAGRRDRQEAAGRRTGGWRGDPGHGRGAWARGWEGAGELSFGTPSPLAGSIACDRRWPEGVG